MPMVDPFTPNAFGLQTLTAAIDHIPYQPGQISRSGLFSEQGISTLTAVVEERDGVLSVVTVKPRGAPGQPPTEGDRRATNFSIPHMPEQETVMADEVQGVRMFGSDNQAEVLQSRINEKLALMRAQIDYTMEVHRVKAIKGTYVDVNGDDVSLFSTFDVSQQTKALGLHATNRSSIATKMHASRVLVRTALGGLPWSGLKVWCGDAFWQALIDDKDVRDTYLNQVGAAELRGDPTQRFTAFGVQWEWYEGSTDATFGSDAYLVPMGVPSLGITRFAPANYVETVNTIGRPYYAKGEPLELNKGWKIEAQSNALNIITRPKAIIKLTIS